MYYNFYATQLMFQNGGDSWKRWNATVRDFLVDTQAQNGKIKGSWFFEKPDLGYAHGGRLYATTLAALTLQVYYRHARLYDEVKSNDALRSKK